MQQTYSLSELQSRIGQEIAVSDWIKINQERIDLFAAATGDSQWIHLDAERCRQESPFETTIAHGFLSLSLLPMFIQHAIRLCDTKLVINYGLNKVRFPAPVPVNSSVRARITVMDIDKLADSAQVIWQIIIERQNGGKPVCAAELLTRHYL